MNATSPEPPRSPSRDANGRARPACRAQRGDVPGSVLDHAAAQHPDPCVERDGAAHGGLFGAGLSGVYYIPALFGTAVYLYGGSVFVKGGLRELRDRLPGMMTLISLAITVAFVFSLAVTLGYPGEALWWELASLVTIMLLGHWIEMRSISQASGALRELARLLPSTAQRIVGETIEDVADLGAP